MTKRQFLINAIAFVLAWLALPFLLACDKGCEEHSGVCACDEPPEKGSQPAQTVQPSDEKPRRGAQPEWQTGEVNADLVTRPSTTTAAEDYKAEKDQQ